MSNIKIIKRDGREKSFSALRIEKVVENARDEIGVVNETLGIDVANLVEDYLEENNIECIGVEQVQDLVVEMLLQEDVEVAKAYKRYREERENERIKNSKKEQFYSEVLQCTNIDNDNANINQSSFSGRKYRIADHEQKQYALRNLISKEGKLAFEQGEIYYHDLASYAIGEHNCSFLNVDNGLKDGFVTRNGDVRTASSYSTACQLIAVMFQCQSQVQYGGVGANHIDFSLTEGVKKSFKKHFKEGLKYLSDVPQSQIDNIFNDDIISINDEIYMDFDKKVYNYAYDKLNKEGKQATEGLYHNLNTLESRAGSQLPFTSINLGRDTTDEGRLINKWIFNASLNGIGKLNKTPIFPISIFQYKKGTNAKMGDKNYDIKQLAIKSLSKRIYPNFVNGDYKQNIEDANNPDTFMSTMGCRTMIGYDIHTDSYDKTGRGNLSPITIILPKLGLDYGIKLGKRGFADEIGFFDKLNSLLDLTRDELITRYEYMCNQSPNSAPFMYDNNLMMNSDKCEDTVRECLKHGTNAIGILGMAECCTAMFGKHHGESIESYRFALKIVRIIDEYCKKASKEYNMNFSQYFTPAENLCKTALETLKIYYGEIEGVTDKKYITNSIHIPVNYQIDAYSKLTLEAPFTQYGSGGCITYVELDNNSVNNLEGLEKLIDYAMDLNIPYLAINFPIDTCKSCGYSSQINGDKCPKCGSTLIERLKRVTGYITVDYRNFNEGKFDEANDRVIHTIFNPQVIPILEYALLELEEMGIGKFDVNKIQ